jgi:hypothetical protein
LAPPVGPEGAFFCCWLGWLDMPPDPVEPLELPLPVADEPLLLPLPALFPFLSQPASVAASARAKARVRLRFMDGSFPKKPAFLLQQSGRFRVLDFSGTSMPPRPRAVVESHQRP